jgi:hypothetical protein
MACLVDFTYHTQRLGQYSVWVVGTLLLKQTASYVENFLWLRQSQRVRPCIRKLRTMLLPFDLSESPDILKVWSAKHMRHLTTVQRRLANRAA